MAIIYASEPNLSVEAFHAILVASTLAERRPAHDYERLNKMLRSADIIVTAREVDKLVGIARAITDYAYTKGLKF